MNFRCACGNEFPVMNSDVIDYNLIKITDYDQMLAGLSENTSPDVIYDVLGEIDDSVWRCPYCGRYFIYTGDYIGSHVIEAQMGRGKMLTPLLDYVNGIVPRRGEAALYHCLCGKTFPVGGESKERQYYLIHGLTLDEVADEDIPPDRLRRVMEVFALLYSCPACGRLGRDFGGDIRVYKYEGRSAQLSSYLGWDKWDGEGNPHKYVFVDAPPPDARLLALQAEYRRIMGEEA